MSLLLLIRALIPFLSDPPLQANQLLKALPPHTFTLGFRPEIYALNRGHKYSVHNTLLLLVGLTCVLEVGKEFRYHSGNGHGGWGRTSGHWSSLSLHHDFQYNVIHVTIPSHVCLGLQHQPT